MFPAAARLRSRSARSVWPLLHALPTLPSLSSLVLRLFMIRGRRSFRDAARHRLSRQAALFSTSSVPRHCGCSPSDRAVSSSSTGSSMKGKASSSAEGDGSPSLSVVLDGTKKSLSAKASLRSASRPIGALLACLGLLPANPSPAIIVVSGVPAPIITPTTTTAATTTTTTTTARPPPAGNMTAPMPPPMSTAPTTATTAAPTGMPPTTAPMPPPTTTTTAAPTPAPTSASPPPMTTASTTIGPLPIDPRLGTTPGLSAALNVPITGYSAQLPSYDTAVKFPRERRSVKPEYDMNIKNFFDGVHRRDRGHNIFKRQSNCACVPIGTCIGATTGAGMIDIRIVTPVATQCPSGQEYCCGSTTSSTAVACGTLQTVPATGVPSAAGQANFGEFPWQGIIMTKQNDYIAGGVLINQLNVLTVTHRLLPYIISGTAPNVKVRLGEWDAAGTYEPVPYQEYTVSKVFTHPSYNANTLQYDITVLRLASAVPFTPSAGAATTINRACLPPSSTSTYTGQRCWVPGWGKNVFGLQGQYQQILKKVDVPIVAPATCQTQLQTARLGPTYVLDTTSFICAGGEANMDSCTGDGGSGLVCQVSGQWVVVGLVAWGLGCAAANVSAAYVNVAGLLPWIQQQIATS